MIVRILNEGQWTLADDATAELNGLDEAVEAAVKAGDEQRLSQALHQLLDKVRRDGTPVPDEELHDSALILPSADATLDEVRDLLNESDEGLVPN